jgi:hypothetical protein
MAISSVMAEPVVAPYFPACRFDALVDRLDTVREPGTCGPGGMFSTH